MVTGIIYMHPHNYPARKEGFLNLSSGSEVLGKQNKICQISQGEKEWSYNLNPVE